MPFASKSQQKYMFSQHPKMAERWAEHTKDIKSLPEHVGDKEKKALDANALLAALGSGATSGVGKAVPSTMLATAAGIPMGGLVGLGRGNPVEGIGRGVVRGAGTGMGAGMGAGIGSQLGQLLGGDTGATVGGLGGAAAGGLGGYALSGKVVGKPKSEKDKEKQASIAERAAEYSLLTKLAQDAETDIPMIIKLARFTQTTPANFVKLAYANIDDFLDVYQLYRGGPVKLSRVKQAIDPSLLQKAISRLTSLAGQARGAIGSAGTAAKAAVQPGGRLEMLGRAGSAVAGKGGLTDQIGGEINTLAKDPNHGLHAVDQWLQKAFGATSRALNPNANVAIPGTEGGGLAGTAARHLTTAGGIGTAGVGAAQMALRGGSPTPQPEAPKTASDQIRKTLSKLVLTKTAELMHKNAASKMLGYLDSVASHMSLEKSAAVRCIQAALTQRTPLVDAIKLAYPHLNDTERKVLAAGMVMGANRYKG